MHKNLTSENILIDESTNNIKINNYGDYEIDKILYNKKDDQTFEKREDIISLRRIIEELTSLNESNDNIIILKK